MSPLSRAGPPLEALGDVNGFLVLSSAPLSSCYQSSPAPFTAHDNRANKKLCDIYLCLSLAARLALEKCGNAGLEPKLTRGERKSNSLLPPPDAEAASSDEVASAAHTVSSVHPGPPPPGSSSLLQSPRPRPPGSHPKCHQLPAGSALHRG